MKPDGVADAEPSDVEAIWRLIRELADYERLSHTVIGSAGLLGEHLFGPDPKCRSWVARLGGEVVGYALGFTTYSTFRTQPGLWMEDLYVSPAHRGKGFGKALLLRVIEFARENGYGRVEWAVLDWNEPSIRFYEAMGAAIMHDWKTCRVELS